MNHTTVKVSLAKLTPCEICFLPLISKFEYVGRYDNNDNKYQS